MIRIGRGGTAIAGGLLLACGTTSGLKPRPDETGFVPAPVSTQAAASAAALPASSIQPRVASAHGTSMPAGNSPAPKAFNAIADTEAVSELPAYNHLKVAARAFWADPAAGTKVERWQRGVTADSIGVTVELVNDKQNGTVDGDSLVVFVAFDALYAPRQSDDPERDGVWDPAAWKGALTPQLKPIPMMGAGQAGKVVFERVPVGKALRDYPKLRIGATIWGLRANVIVLDRNAHWRAVAFAKLMVTPTPSLSP